MVKHMIPEKIPLTTADAPPSLRKMLGLMFEGDEIDQWLAEIQLPELGDATTMEVLRQCVFKPELTLRVYAQLAAIVRRIRRAYAGMTVGDLPSEDAVFKELAEIQKKRISEFRSSELGTPSHKQSAVGRLSARRKKKLLAQAKDMEAAMRSVEQALSSDADTLEEMLRSSQLGERAHSVLSSVMTDTSVAI